MGNRTLTDLEKSKFEDDNGEVTISAKIKNPDSAPLPVKLTNADATVTLNVDLDETEVLATSGTVKGDSGNIADVTTNKELKVEAIQKSGEAFSTNATIQNASLDMKLKDSAGSNTASINSLGELSVSVQNSPSVSVSGTAEIAPKSGEVFPISASSAIPVSGTVSSNATIQNASIAITNSNIGKTVYSESDISGMASSTLRKFISAYRDGHLSKFVNNSYDSNSGLASVSTFQFPEVVSTTAKALKRSRTFESSSPYQIKTETFSLVDWGDNEEAVAPTPTISLGAITHPPNEHETAGTDICTVTIGNLGSSTTCTVALSGANASFYQLNNGVDTPASSITFTTGQTLLIETSASAFPNGYTHSTTVTITANNGKTNTATLNTTQESTSSSSFSNTKYFSKGGDINDYFETTNLTASGSNQILRNTKAWTISFWYKTSSVNMGIFWGSDAGGTAPMHFGIATDNRLILQGAGNTHGYIYYNFIPSADTWYNIVVTNEPVASHGDTWYFNRDDSSSQKGLKVYVNGSVVGQYGAAGGGGSSQGTMFVDSSLFRMFTRGDWQSATGDYDEISIHNTTKSDSEVSSMYASGTPTDLSSDSSAVVWLRADSMNTEGIANSTTIVNSSGSSSASNYVTTCGTNNTGDISVVEY